VSLLLLYSMPAYPFGLWGAVLIVAVSLPADLVLVTLDPRVR
jgi:hypothetical protein